MPDILSVSLQDILYRRQSELRKGEITLRAGREAGLWRKDRRKIRTS